MIKTNRTSIQKSESGLVRLIKLKSFSVHSKRAFRPIEPFWEGWYHDI